jgi:outer membrane protein TolC
MKYRIASIFLFVLTVVTEARGDVLNLTLKEALKMALERNLELRSELYNPAIATAEIIKNLGIYDTLFSFTGNYQDSETYLADRTVGSLKKTLNLSPGISQLIPSGAKIGLAYNNAHIETNSSYSTYPDYWQSDITLSLSQPLLKNFGREPTELNILVAEKTKEESIKRVASKVYAIIAQVKIEYFKLRSLREDLSSKKLSVGLAQRILNEIQERVKAGMLPPMEILNAEYGLALREKELIDAEKGVRDQVNLLRKLLQINGKKDIFAIDAPGLEKVVADEDESIRKALSLRPEIDELKFQLAAAEIQDRVSASNTRPDLNFNASFALTGLANGYGRNMDRLGSADYPVWSVGIQFQYPLGNRTAEGEAKKNKLKVEQTRFQLDNLASAVATEVREAVGGVESSYKQLEVTARGKTFAEERLKAYMLKNTVGLATTKEVLDVENELATARSNEIKAHVTYVSAVTQLLKSTGELLEKEGITINGKTIEELLLK